MRDRHGGSPTTVGVGTRTLQSLLTVATQLLAQETIRCDDPYLFTAMSNGHSMATPEPDPTCAVSPDLLMLFQLFHEIFPLTHAAATFTISHALF